MTRQIFVYEWIVGGGLCEQPAPAGSLLAEGAAMRSALLQDFARIPNCRVTSLRDQRLPSTPEESAIDGYPVATVQEHDAQFRRLAAQADWTVLVAPETDNVLLRLAQGVDDVGGRRLGPHIDVLRWMSDKWETFRQLQAWDIPCPESWLVGCQRPPDSGKWVLKPRDGVGCEETFLVTDPSVFQTASAAGKLGQTWQEGKPASIGILLGPPGPVTLPPCWQRLRTEDTGQLRYRGGTVMAPGDEADRTRRLAALLAPRLAGHGYVGLDVILGAAEDGSQDVIIEGNPRLTTSYVGIRRATRTNLAEAMLQLAEGATPSVAPIRTGGLRFSLTTQKGATRVVVGN